MIDPAQLQKYIYDQQYGNRTKKQKYSKNTKYTYYNLINKIKARTSQQNNKIYKDIFESSTEEVPIQKQQNKLRKESSLFHVEKLNNHLFKIYKNKRNPLLKMKLPQLKEVKFHFQSSPSNPFQPQFLRPISDFILEKHLKPSENKSSIKRKVHMSLGDLNQKKIT